MGVKKTRGRKQGSVLDQYASEIKAMLDSGCTYQQIADELSNHFDDVVNATTVSSYCRRREMRSLVTQGCRNGRIYIPRCDECENCTLIQNVSRTGWIPMCNELKALIPQRVTTSLIDCPKRDFEKYCKDRLEAEHEVSI